MISIGEKNYVKEFYNKFKAQIMQKSPEFWQLLIYDILKLLMKKTINNNTIKIEVIKLLDSEEIANYLIEFKDDLVKYLKKQKFLKKEPQ